MVFWSWIWWWKRTAKFVSQFYFNFKTNLILTKAEVHKPAVAFKVDDNVLRLQIAIDDVDAVQVLDGQQDLGQVKRRHVLGQSVGLVQQAEHVTAGIKLSDEENLLFSLEWADKMNLKIKVGI